MLDPEKKDSMNPKHCIFKNCYFIPYLMIRNTLGRWRLAAVELFNFPLELPVTLHICPEEERDKWIAEIDLDPAYKVNLQFFSQCRGSGSGIRCLFDPWIRDG